MFSTLKEHCFLCKGITQWERKIIVKRKAEHFQRNFITVCLCGLGTLHWTFKLPPTFGTVPIFECKALFSFPFSPSLKEPIDRMIWAGTQTFLISGFLIAATLFSVFYLFYSQNLPSVDPLEPNWKHRITYLPYKIIVIMWSGIISDLDIITGLALTNRKEREQPLLVIGQDPPWGPGQSEERINMLNLWACWLDKWLGQSKGCYICPWPYQSDSELCCI